MADKFPADHLTNYPHYNHYIPLIGQNISQHQGLICHIFGLNTWNIRDYISGKEFAIEIAGVRGDGANSNSTGGIEWGYPPTALTVTQPSPASVSTDRTGFSVRVASPSSFLTRV